MMSQRNILHIIYTFFFYFFDPPFMIPFILIHFVAESIKEELLNNHFRSFTELKTKTPPILESHK